MQPAVALIEPGKHLLGGKSSQMAALAAFPQVKQGGKTAFK
jgi:hypothetical protein